jgi:hypothetical protein
MADNNEKILPVIRLLLAAFFGLLVVLAVQLFFLVSRANSTLRIQRGDQHRVEQTFSWFREDSRSVV